MDTYEAKNQELVAENADLRALLRSMQVPLISYEFVFLFLFFVLFVKHHMFPKGFWGGATIYGYGVMKMY